MLTAILVAIIGNAVFPDVTFWWITYAVVLCTVIFVRMVIDLVKGIYKI